MIQYYALNSNEHLDGEKDGTFQELLVGIAPGSLIDSLYQNAYRDPDFQNIGHQLLWALNGCREVLSTHLAQVQLEIMRHKVQHNQAEARRLQESKMGSEMKQRCIHLEHKVQDLERRNARLDRQLGEMRAELEKSQRQLEAYKAHYVRLWMLGLKKKLHSKAILSVRTSALSSLSYIFVPLEQEAWRVSRWNRVPS